MTWVKDDEKIITIELIGGGIPHTLSIDSDPSGISFTLNGLAKITPYSEVLAEGTYTVKMPPEFNPGTNGIYYFTQWENGATNPNRTINLTTDMSLTATYNTQPPADQFPWWILGASGAALLALILLTAKKKCPKGQKWDSELQKCVNK